MDSPGADAVVLSVTDLQHGLTDCNFRVKKDKPLKRMMSFYCERQKKDMSKVIFAVQIFPHTTPASIGLRGSTGALLVMDCKPGTARQSENTEDTEEVCNAQETLGERDTERRDRGSGVA